MTPFTLLRKTASRFRSAGIPDPETDSALLLSFLTGGAPLVLRLDNETELTPEVLDAYSALAERRLAREPLQYIIGESPFFGHDFLVDPRVLIPRPETELLCSWALELIPSSAAWNVLDLCCGSGCIGLSLALARPSLSLTLSDISEEALSVAGTNAKRLGVQAVLHRGDLAEGFPPATFDLVVSNPPYIPSNECSSLQPEVLREPVLALDGGTDGLDFYRRIAAESSSILKANGLLLMELGFGESKDVSDILLSAGFTDVSVREDLNGIPRMILASASCSEGLCLTD